MYAASPQFADFQERVHVIHRVDQEECVGGGDGEPTHGGELEGSSWREEHSYI